MTFLNTLTEALRNIPDLPGEDKWGLGKWIDRSFLVAHNNVDYTLLKRKVGEAISQYTTIDNIGEFEDISKYKFLFRDVFYRDWILEKRKEGKEVTTIDVVVLDDFEDNSTLIKYEDIEIFPV